MSEVNKSARERTGRQNLSQKVPSKKGSLGVIFSPSNQRENAPSKSANFEARRSGGHLLGRPTPSRGRPLPHRENIRTQKFRFALFFRADLNRVSFSTPDPPPLLRQEPLNAPFLNGLFSRDLREGKRPLRTKSGKRPIKVRKRPIKDGNRPIKVMVLVGVSVGCLIGLFSGTPAKAENGTSKKAN